MLSRFLNPLLLAVLMAIGLFQGCGQTGPISSQDAMDQAPGVVRAAKSTGAKNSKAGAEVAVVTNDVGVSVQSKVATRVHNYVEGQFWVGVNGMLSVKFPDYGGSDQVRLREVELVVKKGSLDVDTFITMDVTGGTALEDINVKFGPSGTEFHPPALLIIKLQGGARQDLTAYHFSDDQVGKVSIEKVSIGDSDGWKVTVEVPGFSRYSLGGDK